MPTLAKRLTKRTIDATPTDSTRGIVLWDGGDGAVKGFGLRLRPSGRRTFIFQYDVAGRARRVTLGDLGALTVDRVRDVARRCAADAAAAKRDGAQLDPATKVRQAKARARAHALAPTVTALAAAYLEDRRRVGKKARTLEQFADIIDRLITPALGERKVGDVTRRDVERLMRDRAKTPGMANLVCTVLAAMFAFTEREELRPAHTNPTVGVERYPEPRRARSLTEAEYGVLGATLDRAAGSCARWLGYGDHVIAGLTLRGLEACMRIAGAADTPVMVAFVKRVLVPVLRPGQIVILDNLSVHKAPAVRRRASARSRRSPPPRGRRRDGLTPSDGLLGSSRCRCGVTLGGGERV